MMIIKPMQTMHMQRHARRLRKTLKTMRNHLATQVSYFFPLQTEIYDCEGTVGEIDYSPRKCLVEGRETGAEACKACVVFGEGEFEGGAKGEAGVFGCVVVVDCPWH
jgi:hypothetical protein